MDNNYSLSDIASVARENDGFGGGNSAWVLILLFAMIFGWGNGGFGNNNNNNGLAQTDLNLLNAIQNGQRDIESRVQEVGTENISAIKDASYNNLAESRNIGDAVAVGFSGMQSSFCETQRAIDGVNYNGAINTASINSNIDNKFASLEKSLLEQRLNEQSQQITQLQTAQLLCGVPKVNPYAFGTYPYSNACCGSNI